MKYHQRPIIRYRGEDWSSASRQQTRQSMFFKILAEINKRYGGEPRRNRRAIARTIMHRTWKERTKA